MNGYSFTCVPVFYAHSTHSAPENQLSSATGNLREVLKMLARVRLNVRTILTALTILLVFCSFIAVRSMNQAQAKSNLIASVSSVNAASFMGPLAPGTMTAGFGSNLATQTEVAQS